MSNGDIKVDAYSPSEISEKVCKIGVSKANLDFLSTLMLAILAGAFIAFGAVLATLAIHDSNLSFGLTKLLGGLVFCARRRDCCQHIRIILYHQTYGDKIHIGYRMFKTQGNKGCNWKNYCYNFIYNTPSAETEPYCQTDQNVAKHTSEKRY